MPRAQAFCAAIAAQAKGKVCLDIGTGSLALLAIAAAEAGARRVYALEANASAAELARRSVVAAGYEDVITVLQGFSMDIGLAEGQPQSSFCCMRLSARLPGRRALSRHLPTLARAIVARARQPSPSAQYPRALGRCSRPPSGHPPNTLMRCPFLCWRCRAPRCF